MTHEHVVVLRILVDGTNGGAKPWWEALGLPPPESWDEHFAENVHVSVVLGKEVRRG